MKRRAYNQRRRLELQAATRLRIVQATVDLHRELGPAATTISAVAERAGVQRHTVYRHFPDQEALFGACTRHFLASHPPPDPATWTDPRQGLGELYGYYEANQRMIASVLRDSEVMPVGRGFKSLQQAAIAALTSPGARADEQPLLQLATDFRAWRALDLTAQRSAELMARLLECARS